MIDYFRDGIIESITIAQTSAAKIKIALFQFCYAQAFYCMCHPLFYSILLIWEALQEACLTIIPVEQTSIQFEFKIANTYIPKILVNP
jgi:hypothetical protein